MSELKAGVIHTPHDEGMTFVTDSDTISVNERETEFYIKSEADKVIAELEKKLDIYKRGWMENDRVNANQYAEIRHHKYKRCLAIANGCKDKINYWHIRYTTAAGYDRSYEKWKYRLLIKWRNRWLELAEKFKEAK